MIDPRRGESQSLTRLEAGVCWFKSRNLQLHDLPDLTGEIPIFFGSGGASFYDRQKLLALEGSTRSFTRFTWRMWTCRTGPGRAGWKCLFEPTDDGLPRDQFDHPDPAPETEDQVHRRPQPDAVPLAQYHRPVPDRSGTFLCLPFSLLYDIIGFRKYKFVGFFRALRYLPMIPGGRRSRKAYFRVSDREVIGKVSR